LILTTLDLKSLNSSAKKVRKGLFLHPLTESHTGSLLLPSKDPAPTYSVPVVLVLGEKSKKEKRAVEFFDRTVRLLGVWSGDSSKYSSMSLRDSYESMGIHFLFAQHVTGLSSSWRVTDVIVSPSVKDFFQADIGHCLFHSPVPTSFCRRKTTNHGSYMYSPEFHKIAKEG